MSYIIVIPAYGKDYKTQKEVKAAFDAGKDFEITDMFHRGGRYVNKRDLPAGHKLQVRYAAGRKVMMLP